MWAERALQRAEPQRIRDLGACASRLLGAGLFRASLNIARAKDGESDAYLSAITIFEVVGHSNLSFRFLKYSSNS